MFEYFVICRFRCRILSFIHCLTLPLLNMFNTQHWTSEHMRIRFHNGVRSLLLLLLENRKVCYLRDLISNLNRSLPISKTVICKMIKLIDTIFIQMKTFLWWTLASPKLDVYFVFRRKAAIWNMRMLLSQNVLFGSIVQYAFCIKIWTMLGHVWSLCNQHFVTCGQPIIVIRYLSWTFPLPILRNSIDAVCCHSMCGSGTKIHSKYTFSISK